MKEKLYVLVKNYRGLNLDVDVFKDEKACLEAFREYTGFEWNRYYTDEPGDFSETRIFEVDL